MRKGKKWLTAVLVGLAVLGVWSSTAVASEKYYQREVLFSATYGSRPDQIGIRQAAGHTYYEEAASLWKLCVPTSDAIYVADAVQRRIKRYDAAGRVTLVAQFVLERLDVEGEPEILTDIDILHDFAATPQGLFFAALTGINQKVEVFEPTGMPQASLRDAEGRILEARGWDKLIRQVLQHVPRKSRGTPRIFVIDTDQFGHVYLHVAPAPNEYNVSLAKFDADLNLVGTMPGYMVGWDGTTYGFVPSGPSEPKDRLRVYAPDGTLERVITLSPPADISKGDYDSTLRQWRGLHVLYDARGDIYLVLNRRRPVDQWKELMPEFRIMEDIVVYKFDGFGNFLTKVVFDGLPFWMDPPLAVDPEGNIYHLEYHEDRVDFVRERLLMQPGAATAGESTKQEARPLTLAWRRPVLEGARIAVSRDGGWVALKQADERGRQMVAFLDGQGKEKWRHYLEAPFKLGRVRISPDGDRVFVGFYTPPTGPVMPPHSPVPFRGGILCLDRDGNVVWRVEREAVSEGGPVASPYGHVEQVTDRAIVCLGPEMEGFTGVTVLRPDTGEVLWEKADLWSTGAVIAESWDFLLLRTEETTAYDLDDGHVRWEANTRLFWSSSRAVTPDGTFVLTQRARFPIVPGTDADSLSYIETFGFTVYDRSGGLLMGAGQYAFTTGGYIPRFLQLARTINRAFVWDGEIGANEDGITVLILLGPSRTLYRIRPLPGGEGPRTVTSVSLPDALSLASWTTLSPNGTRVAIIERVGLLPSDDRPPALHVSLFDDEANLLEEASLELDPDISRREGLRYLWSQDGRRLYVLWGGRLAAFDIR